MNKSKIFSSLFAAFLLASVMPTVVSAASIEITKSIKSSLEKVTNADGTHADKISSLWNELLTLQKQEQDLDGAIKALHAKNKDTLTALGKEIKQIDAGKLQELESDVTETRERYKPLFSTYSTLNKQLAEARKLKNKELSSTLSFELNVLKIPVQLARIDVKTKENALRTAKEGAATKMKAIRGVLADIEPVNVKIKGGQSAIKGTRTAITPQLNTFKQAVKKEDPSIMQETLEGLVSLLRQVNEEKQTIYNHEGKISDILSAAKANMP